jgi:tetratricopeptide (TPR) repeat protein
VDVCVVTDIPYRIEKPGWDSELKSLSQSLNRIFQKTRVQWRLTAGTEAIPASPAASGMMARNEVLKDVACKADVILGLTSQTDREMVSTAAPFSHTLLVQDTASNTPAMTALLVARSLADLFGADYDTRGLMIADAGGADVFSAGAVELIRAMRDYDFSQGLGGLSSRWEGRAVKAFSAALSAKRPHPAAEAHRVLARAFATSHRYDDAARHFREALRSDAQNPGWHFDLAMALAAASEANQALDELRLAAGLDGENAMYHAAAGAILLNNRRIEPAIEELQAAVRLDPRNASYQAVLGQALSRQPGRVRDAAAAFQAAVELRPLQAGALSGLVQQQQAQQQYSELLQVRQAELNKSPSSAEAHLKVGVAFAYAGDLESAQKEIRRAIGMEPSNGSAHLALGRVCYLTGRYAEADAELRAAGAAGVKAPAGMIEALDRKLGRAPPE